MSSRRKAGASSGSTRRARKLPPSSAPSKPASGAAATAPAPAPVTSKRLEDAFHPGVHRPGVGTSYPIITTPNAPRMPLDLPGLEADVHRRASRLWQKLQMLMLVPRYNDIDQEREIARDLQAYADAYLEEYLDRTPRKSEAAALPPPSRAEQSSAWWGRLWRRVLGHLKQEVTLDAP